MRIVWTDDGFRARLDEHAVTWANRVLDSTDYPDGFTVDVMIFELTELSGDGETGLLRRLLTGTGSWPGDWRLTSGAGDEVCSQLFLALVDVDPMLAVWAATRTPLRSWAPPVALVEALARPSVLSPLLALLQPWLAFAHPDVFVPVVEEYGSLGSLDDVRSFAADVLGGQAEHAFAGDESMAAWTVFPGLFTFLWRKMNDRFPSAETVAYWRNRLGQAVAGIKGSVTVEFLAAEPVYADDCAAVAAWLTATIEEYASGARGPVPVTDRAAARVDPQALAGHAPFTSIEYWSDLSVATGCPLLTDDQRLAVIEFAPADVIVHLVRYGTKDTLSSAVVEALLRRGLSGAWDDEDLNRPPLAFQYALETEQVADIPDVVTDAVTALASGRWPRPVDTLFSVVINDATPAAALEAFPPPTGIGNTLPLLPPRGWSRLLDRTTLDHRNVLVAAFARLIDQRPTMTDCLFAMETGKTSGLFQAILNPDGSTPIRYPQLEEERILYALVASSPACPPDVAARVLRWILDDPDVDTQSHFFPDPKHVISGDVNIALQICLRRLNDDPVTGYPADLITDLLPRVPHHLTERALVALSQHPSPDVRDAATAALVQVTTDRDLLTRV